MSILYRPLVSEIRPGNVIIMLTHQILTENFCFLQKKKKKKKKNKNIKKKKKKKKKKKTRNRFIA